MLLLATTVRMEHGRGTGPKHEAMRPSQWTSVGLRSIGAALLAAALFAVGCGNDYTPPKAGVTANETDQRPDPAAQLAQQEKNEFLQAAQQEMDAIKADLDALKVQADSAQGAAKQKLQQQVQLLEEKWHAAAAQLAALRAESTQAWAEMKQQVLIALADLKQSYQEVRREMTAG